MSSTVRAEEIEAHGRSGSKMAVRLVVCCLVVLGLCGCETINRTLFGEDANKQDIPPVEMPVTTPVTYDVHLEGDLPADARGLVEQSSALISRKDRPPASYAALGKRVDDDVGRTKDVLASQGYYDAEVKATIIAESEPAQVLISVEPGPLFHLEAVEIQYQPMEPVTAVPTTATDIGLAIGQPAAGAPLVDAERRLIRRLTESGYPNARIVNRRYLANRDTDAVTAILTVDTGPFARFGALTVTGLQDVDPAYIETISEWKPGSPYDIREIERVRTTLSRTRLFSTITPPPTEGLPVENGEVPVTFAVGEGPPRSVGIGAYYSTDEQGPGVSLSWEHRNLFGAAESLRLALDASLVRQMATADFRKPAFYDLNQAMVANLGIDRNDTDAFKGVTGSAFIGIERKFAEFWSFTAGPALIYTDIEQSGGVDDRSQYLLAGARTRLAYDSRDDPLNPSKGLNGSISVSPFTSVALTSTSFVIGEGALSGYQSVLPEDRVVLAARGRVGSIFGSSRSKIPASQRFYAGGGGSVRGYEFQSIGPLDSKDDPIGGRSVVEVNAEARIKVIDQIGVVPFVDGGQVYDEIYPQVTSGDLQWAGGLGLRYYSPVGPIRLDVAFPINPRPVDDSFQFYIAIGQAF